MVISVMKSLKYGWIITGYLFIHLFILYSSIGFIILIYLFVYFFSGSFLFFYTFHNSQEYNSIFLVNILLVTFMILVNLPSLAMLVHSYID